MEYAQMRFKELRLSLGLSQAEMAARMGIHQTAWGRFETGKVKDPQASTITQVCRTFNISADWLLGLSSKGGPVGPERGEK